MKTIWNKLQVKPDNLTGSGSYYRFQKYKYLIFIDQSCIEFKKFTKSSNESTFNSSSQSSPLSFMN